MASNATEQMKDDMRLGSQDFDKPAPPNLDVVTDLLDEEFSDTPTSRSSMWGCC